MISNPKHGWCNIQIGNWSGKLSYIDDVPMMLLNALREPTSRVHFDTEGGDIYIFFTEEMTYIVDDSEGTYEPDLYIENVSRIENIYSLFYDITEHTQEWTDWGKDFDEEDPEREATLLSKANYFIEK